MTRKEELLNTIELCIEKKVPICLKGTVTEIYCEVSIEMDYEIKEIYNEITDIYYDVSTINVDGLSELYKKIKEYSNEDLYIEGDNSTLTIEEFYPVLDEN